MPVLHAVKVIGEHLDLTWEKVARGFAARP